MEKVHVTGGEDRNGQEVGSLGEVTLQVVSTMIKKRLYMCLDRMK